MNSKNIFSFLVVALCLELAACSATNVQPTPSSVSVQAPKKLLEFEDVRLLPDYSVIKGSVGYSCEFNPYFYLEDPEYTIYHSHSNWYKWVIRHLRGGLIENPGVSYLVQFQEHANKNHGASYSQFNNNQGWASFYVIHAVSTRDSQDYVAMFYENSVAFIKVAPEDRKRFRIGLAKGNVLLSRKPCYTDMQGNRSAQPAPVETSATE